jgi:glycosyltransferase involved in cell wall biosynthesis
MVRTRRGASCFLSFFPNVSLGLLTNGTTDEYITQIARFDPSKGIFDVLESYLKFHEKLADSAPDVKPPKLLICGHGSVDDPDGSAIYDAVLEYVKTRLAHLEDYITVMRLPPTDQVLNILLSKAKVALQLSSREGFEVKVSEAVHKGKPVIATMAGGIPLQVQDQVYGYLVEVGDTEAVAQHLYDLYTDEELYKRMSNAALTGVSDEVSTVGNIMCWLYLASKLSNGDPIKPNGRWINDMAREEAGQPYQPGEPRLKRAVEVEKMK